jgi:prephenate dehydrogenase
MTSLLADKRITIAGFGLMGGSLALALRPHTPHITAVDPHPDSLAQAVQRQIADRAFPDLAAALPETDLLILAAPSRAIVSAARPTARHLAARGAGHRFRQRQGAYCRRHE